MCWKVPNLKMPTVDTTARDIVSDRTNTDPESPIFGGDQNDIGTRKGVKSLQIKPLKDPINANVGTNSYFSKIGGGI